MPPTLTSHSHVISERPSERAYQHINFMFDVTRQLGGHWIMTSCQQKEIVDKILNVADAPRDQREISMLRHTEL